MDVYLVFVACYEDRNLGDGPITRPGDSYRVFALMCNYNHLHLQWDGSKRFE